MMILLYKLVLVVGILGALKETLHISSGQQHKNYTKHDIRHSMHCRWNFDLNVFINVLYLHDNTAFLIARIAYMYMLRPDSQPLTGFQAGQTNQRLENVNQLFLLS